MLQNIIFESVEVRRNRTSSRKKPVAWRWKCIRRGLDSKGKQNVTANYNTWWNYL